MSENEIPELSLQERMLLVLRKTSRSSNIHEGITAGSIIFLGISMVFVFTFLNTISITGTLEPLGTCLEFLNVYVCEAFTTYENYDADMVISSLYSDFTSATIFIIITLIMLGAVAIWWVVKGRNTKKELHKVVSDYRNQAYYFVLSTSTHGKTEDITLDFFDIVEEIFPELKEEDIISEKKTGEQLDIEELVIEDAKGKGSEYLFNVVAKTKEGFFLIKHFDKEQVSELEIKEMIKIAKENFKTWTKGVFRLVCLAKSFEKNVLENYEKNNDKLVPLDLITVQEKGFSFAKIGKDNI